MIGRLSPRFSTDGVAGTVIENAKERARRLLGPEDEEALETMALLITGGWLPHAHPGTQEIWDEFRIREVLVRCGRL